MDYCDFDLEIGPGAGNEYPVRVINSPAGQARETMRFPFGELELKNRLQQLEIALLRSGGKHRRVLSPEQQAVQDFGCALFDALITGEVRVRYDVSMRSAALQGCGLRLKLRINTPEMAVLPWEFLYDPRRADYICLSQDTPIVRYLELPQPVQPLSITPPLRVLGMVAAPRDLIELNVNVEKQRVEDALCALQDLGIVELTWLEGQTSQDLQRALRQDSWHIFHFIGHGGFNPADEEGYIALENKEGLTDRFSATKLARLLANARDHSLRLALLNTCESASGSTRDLFSSTAAILVQRGLPAVLAMQYAITDRAAIELARTFYESLVDGLPVDMAVVEARVAISLAHDNSVEWGIPVLHLRSPDGILFKVGASSALSVVAPKLRSRKSTPREYPEERTLEPEPTLQNAPTYHSQALTSYHTRNYSTALADFTRALELDPENAEAYKNRGKTYEALHESTKAIADYTRAIELNAEDAEAYILRGSVYGAMPKYVKALNDYTRAIELDPESVTAYNNRGGVYQAMDMYDQALADYTRAIELDPESATAYNNRGNVYQAMDMYDQALADYTRAIELDPESATAYRNRGVSYYYMDMYDQALADYTRAIELDPENVTAHNNRGVTYDNMGEYAKALNDYTRAIELDSENARYFLHRGSTYDELGEYAQALNDYTRAIELDPENATTYNNRGVTYDNMGEYAKALNDYTRAIELDPESVTAYNNRGGVYQAMDMYDQALADYTRAIELDPENAMAYNNRGDIYKAMDMYDQALADYTRAIELDSENARYFLDRGSTYRYMCMYTKALDDCTRAIELDPESATAYWYQGLTHSAMKNYTAALDDYTRAIEIDPKYAVAYWSRGKTYYSMEDYALALDDITRSIELAPEDASAYLIRGKIYHMMDEYGKALTDFNRALELDPGNAAVYYRGAIVHADLRHTADARVWLKKAIALDEEWLSVARISYDFNHIGALRRFIALISAKKALTKGARCIASIFRRSA